MILSRLEKILSIEVHLKFTSDLVFIKVIAIELKKYIFKIKDIYVFL